MRKLEKRALICVVLAMILFVGLFYYVLQLALKGESWATFEGNMLIYNEGQLNRGKIYDRDGLLLVECNENGVIFNEDSNIRKALAHTTGDLYGNISTGILESSVDKMVGYSFINGIFTIDDKGEDVYLTLDAEACKVAYEALGSHNGTVGVYNYKTGEILCLVNKPVSDPVSLSDGEGSYFNTFFQGTVIPGSTFKVVTSIAAIESLVDIDGFSYECSGGDEIKCTYAHGVVGFENALAKSCNGAFGEITNELGPGIMEEYVTTLGLTDSYKIEGINTKKGEFVFSENKTELAWAGIGQGMDRINPCSMMMLMGAIANDGESIEPYYILNNGLLNSNVNSLGQIIDKKTATKIEAMLKNNVVVTYGESNYENLDIYAKSGTAEIDGQSVPNGLFTGYIKNENHPYAFFVYVEKGGSGNQSAGIIAKKVLYSLIN